MIAVGVDVGSTSIKALAIDAETREIVASYSEALECFIPNLPSGRHELDSLLLRKQVHRVIASLAARVRDSGRAIERIAFTGQMHGGLFIDRDFQPLSNCITWQDKRADEPSPSGKPLISEIRESLPRAEWDLTGGDIFTGFLGATAHWFARRNEMPEHGTLIGIYDWLASELCGEAVTDPSSASAWGMYDIVHHTWSSKILHALGLTEEMLPRVVPTGEVAGNVRSKFSELLLNSNVLVVSGMGDTQASYLGSGCRREELLLNVGTGSQCMWRHEGFVRLQGSDTRILTGNTYLITISTLSGGLAYALLAEFIARTLQEFTGQSIAKEGIYRRMNELATDKLAASEKLNANEAPIFSPLFNGSRQQGEQLRASIVHLTRQNFTIDELIRAAIVGMIDELAVPFLALPAAERNLHGILASGNGIRRNPAMQQIAEQRFGLPLRIGADVEEAALGAAMAAAK